MITRNRHLDIAKGLGILFVVLGHNQMISEESRRMVFSFHMPLFFFLSGVFFSSERSLRSTLSARLDSLIKPYWVTLTGLGLLLAFYKNIDIGAYFCGVLYGNGGTLYWEQLWFIPHLFVVTVFSWGIVRLFDNLRLSVRSRCVVLVLLLVFGIANIDGFRELEFTLFGRSWLLPGAPLSMDIILVTSFYFLMGKLCASVRRGFLPNRFMVGGCLVLFVTLHVLFDMTIDFNLRRYDGVLVPTAEALAGIYLVLTVSHYLNMRELVARILAIIGSASLFILLFNGLLQGHVYSIVASLLGERYFVADGIAFLAASLVPVAMWLVVRKIPFLRLMFLPVRPKHAKNGDR